MIEIWRDIPEYEGAYRISNLGRVKSFQRKEEKVLKQVQRLGYMHVQLRKNGKYLAPSVHRLVAAAFISNPNSYPFCGHENDCKWDNRASNLYWTTAKENSVHNGINQKKKPKKLKITSRPTKDEKQYIKWLDSLIPGLGSFKPFVSKI